MKRYIATAIAGAALLAAPAFAQETDLEETSAGSGLTAAETQLNDMISEASLPTEPAREADILERMSKWLNGQVWQNGGWVDDPTPVTGKMIEDQVNASGGMMVQGVGTIGASATNPNFGKLRVLAYEKALNQARIAYLLAKGQKIKSDLYSSLNGICDDTPPKYDHDLPKSQEEEILRKTLALTGAKLDRALEELGVDKAKYTQATPPQRHVMMSEAVGRQTLIRSFGELSGLMPVQTFEGFRYNKDEKVPCIGVICSVTESSRQLAQDILKLRGDFPQPKKKGFALEPYYRSIEDKLPDMFGVRRMKDADGYPVLVAFGQWSSSKQTGNATLAIRYGDLAAKQADTWARSELGLFLDSNFVYERPSEMGGMFEEAVNVFADDSVQDDSQQKVMDKISEKMLGKSEVQISGVRVLHSWSRPHPDYPNVMLYGTVVAWSPAYEKVSRNLSKPLSPSRPGVPAQSPVPASPAGAASRQSVMDMDLDDF